MIGAESNDSRLLVVWHSSDKVIGRTDDLRAIARAFNDETRDDENARMVTLVGPGGIGKTTIARAYAASCPSSIVVDLNNATTVAELCDRIIGRVPTTSFDPLADPISYVAALLDSLGETLLVLDDFDALVPVALETLPSLLDQCPELSILVTSRERLLIPTEYVYEVRALADGVPLLLLAAERVSLGYMIPASERAMLGEIASLLEGVPLALDLAGARLPIVGAPSLLNEARSGMALQRRTHGGPERHASIDAAVRGSYEALSSAERDVLAQATVFRGGFTIDEACAVMGGKEAGDVVLRLHARSLIWMQNARFDLYAQIRDFVVREPDNEKVIDAAIDRHALYFVGEALRRHDEETAESRAWLLDARANLLEVIRRVVTDQAPPTAARAEVALRAVLAAKDVLFARGPSAELIQLVSPLVEQTRSSGADPKWTARVMLLRGALRREEGDVRGSLKDLLAAESVARAVRDDRLMAEASIELGKTVRSANELAAAQQKFEHAARVFGEIGARAREAEAIALAGATAGEGGDLATAQALSARAVALAGSDRVIGASLHLVLARAHAETGDHEAARNALPADDDDHNTHNANADEASILRALICREEGNLDEAHRVLTTARDRYATRGLTLLSAIALGHLGAIAVERGAIAEGYAALVEARDTCALAGTRAAAAPAASSFRTRAHRPQHAVFFATHLAAIETSLGRNDAAKHILDRALPWRSERDGGDAWWPMSCHDPFSLHGRLLARCLSSIANDTHLRERAVADDALIVGKEGRWFRLPHGARVSLERRRSLALVLHQLATSPGTTLVARTLFAAAWPGEKAAPSAAAHRVRVAVATLRKMGLRDVLITTPDGYALSKDVPCVRA